MIRLAAAALGASFLFGNAAYADEAAVRKAIGSLVPGAPIDSVAESVVPGFYEVILKGQVVYVSEDGRYLLQGSLYDIPNKLDVTEQAKAGIRRAALAGIGPDKRIVYAPKDAKDVKHTITVFTDIDCGYCRRMHQQMAEYNDLGIAIEYLFFPRAGIGSESYDKAVNVWCADNPREALTQAKAGQPVPEKTCANPIEEEYALGNNIGVTGTPAVIAEDGTQLGGYVPPQQLLQRLDELAAKAP